MPYQAPIWTKVNAAEMNYYDSRVAAVARIRKRCFRRFSRDGKLSEEADSPDVGCRLCENAFAELRIVRVAPAK